MTMIPIGGARSAAMERLRTICRAQYAAELAAARAAHLPALPGGFVCPAPTADAVFISRRIDPIEAVRNHGVVLAMAPASARRPIGTYSCGPLELKVHTTFEVDCAVIFQAEMQDAPLVGGVELEGDELLHLMAELHSAALINTIHKYHFDGLAIHDVRLVDDYPPEITQSREGVWGMAMTTFEITQIVKVPKRRALPTP